MTIQYGKVQFTTPEPFDSWQPPNEQGLYVLLYLAKDAEIGKREFRILYVGETGDYSTRGWDTHEGLVCAKGKISADQEIYIAIYKTPDWSDNQRRELEDVIKEEEEPRCNK